MQRILGRSVHPSRFRVILRNETMARNLWTGGTPPSMPIKVETVAQDQIVNALAKEGEKFCFLHIHRTQHGEVAARASSLMVNGEINGQLSHPARFLEWNHIGMLTQAPSNNARAGPGRPDDKDRFVHKAVFGYLHLWIEIVA